ncbi:MAG: apolipoprotein N-acyltransferase [Trueperaceae bacterium]
MRPSIVAALSGLLLTFALPPIGWWPLAFAITPLFVLVARAPGGRNAFRLGAAFALPFFALYILWLPRSFAAMFGPSFWLVFPLLLAILAVFWGLTTWASWRLAGGASRVSAGRRVLLLLPAAWVLVEWARTQGYFAFPWGTLGYTWVDTPVAQLADIVGVYGLSLLVTVPAALVAAAFVQPGMRSPGAGRTLDLRPSAPRAGLVASGPSSLVAVLAAVVVVAGAFAWGATRGPGVPLAEAPQPPLRALLVQGNVDPFARAVNAARELRIHLDLTTDGAQVAMPDGDSVAANSQTVDLVVWPEGAVLGHSLEGAGGDELRATIAETAPGAAFLVGGRAYEGNRSYNALYSFEEGALHGRYDKYYLVPFGERWPLIDQLEGAYRAVFGMFGLPLLASTSAGAGPYPLATPLGDVAAFICYESVFPQVQRRMVADGGRLLVLATNDAWFGRGNGARQHFDMGRLRAIETRRWLLRAGNDGVTAAVDPYGRVTAELPQAVADTLLVGFALRDDMTIWVRYGAWLAPALALWLVSAAFLVRRMAGR